MELDAIGLTEALGEHASNPAQPRSSGEHLQALGRDWVVSSCELRIKAQFEQWVRANAYRGVREAEEFGGPEEGTHARSQYLADRGAGHYNWEGRHCRNALDDLPGIAYLFFLLLRRCQPDVTPEVASAVFKDNPGGCTVSLQWALGNSSAPGGAGADRSAVPPPQAPTTTPTGTAPTAPPSSPRTALTRPSGVAAPPVMTTTPRPQTVTLD